MNINDNLIKHLRSIITEDNRNYTANEKKELLELLIELTEAKAKKRKPKFDKVFNSVAKVYFGKEFLNYLMDNFPEILHKIKDIFT